MFAVFATRHGRCGNIEGRAAFTRVMIRCLREKRRAMVGKRFDRCVDCVVLRMTVAEVGCLWILGPHLLEKSNL